MLVAAIICFSANIAAGATDMASYRIHITSGLNNLKSGQLRFARADFEFIIRHQEWDAIHRSVAYLNLGVISFMEGNLDAAIQNYQHAIRTNPDYAEAYFNLGAAYYKQRLLKQAEDAFVKAIKLQPDFGRAHYSLGSIYFEQQKYDLAREHADKAQTYGVPYTSLTEKLKSVGH
jgi:tetratricopeptide (TPR) repeat protein